MSELGDEIRRRVRGHIDAARQRDPDFEARLRQRLIEDKPILDRLEAMEHAPCPSTALAVLGMVGEPAEVRCGLLIGHNGPHFHYIEWSGRRVCGNCGRAEELHPAPDSSPSSSVLGVPVEPGQQ